MSHHLALVLLPAVFLYACESASLDANSSGNYSSNTYSLTLVITDTLWPDYTDRFLFYDYEPQRKRFLAMSQTDGKIYEFDSTGHIAQVADRKEGPQGYGQFVEKIGFFGPDRRIVQGINAVYIYDADWEILQKWDYNAQAPFYVLNQAKLPVRLYHEAGESYLSLNSKDAYWKEWSPEEAPLHKAKFMNLRNGEIIDAFPLPQDHLLWSLPNVMVSDMMTSPQLLPFSNGLYYKHPFLPEAELWKSIFDTEPIRILKPAFGQMNMPPIPSSKATSKEEFLDDIKFRLKHGSWTLRSEEFILEQDTITFISYIEPSRFPDIDNLDMMGFIQKQEELSGKGHWQAMINGMFTEIEFEVDFPSGTLLQKNEHQFFVQIPVERFEEEPDRLPFAIYELKKIPNKEK